MKFLFRVCVASLLLSELSSFASEPLNLWYREPAQKWVEALPLGNGRLGGMVFGGVEREHIQFNEQTLWLGDEIDMGSYQPFGELFVDFAPASASDYRRELSLDDAIHRVSYSANGVKFLRECFVSQPDQIMVLHFTADKPGNYSGTVQLTDMHKAAIRAEGNKLISTGALTNNLAYEAQVLVLNDGGKVDASNNRITVTKADGLTILLAAGTSFANDPAKGWRGAHPHETVSRQLDAAAKKSFEQLRAAHIADFQNLFSRVKLDLGASPDTSTLDRLDAYKQHKNDPALEALLFQYGRYLLISSSRPGGIPANLQGIWNADLRPAWYSGYTTDINIEMNYWLAETTALPECTEPLFTWIQHLATVRKKGVQEALKTKRGWIIYSTNNPMGGNSTWQIHRPGSAWLVQHLWSHYAFGSDKDFLRSVAYPALKDVVEYWEDHLVARPDGKLITPDGWSPEHGPGGKGDGHGFHPGVSYDQEIVWDLFSNYIEAADELGVDSDYRAKVAAMRDKLLTPKIGKWGQLQEWMEDADDPNDHHRHTSHLFAVYPGRQISPLTMPELANAAKVSLNARGDVSTGWSTAWKINFWARLHDGDRAHKLAAQLISACMLPNLFDTHPPFQMDGNFGCTSGIAEMLLQSQLKESGGYVLHLLPALPAAWPDGSVSGFRARGGFDVAMKWQKGKLISATIHSFDGNPCRLLYGNDSRLLKIARGENYEWTAAK